MRAELEGLFALDGAEFRQQVLGNAMALAHELREIPAAEIERLRAVVAGSWPAGGVRAHVERTANQVSFSDHGAYAWLSLAPALDLAPTAEQWADLATSNAVLTETAEWLRKHYTLEAAVIAAKVLDSKEAKVWDQLLSAIPGEEEVPEEVIERIVEHVQTVNDPRVDLWSVGERLSRAGRLDALQALSDRGRDLEQALRPWRARLGEREAARALIAEMTESIRSGGHREWDNPDWLEGVSDSALLPALFEALRAELNVERDDPFGPGHSIHRAIMRIGGEDAVRRYDELIEDSADSRFKFLRIQRDEVVQAELRRAGQARAEEVASALEIPALTD